MWKVGSSSPDRNRLNSLKFVLTILFPNVQQQVLKSWVLEDDIKSKYTIFSHKEFFTHNTRSMDIDVHGVGNGDVCLEGGGEGRRRWRYQTTR